MINGHGQSDGDIVPEKSSNKSDPEMTHSRASTTQGIDAERTEGRSPVKGNAQEHPSHRTRSRTEEMQSMLERMVGERYHFTKGGETR